MLNIWDYYKEYLEQRAKEKEEEVEALIRSAFANGSPPETIGEEGVQSETEA